MITDILFTVKPVNLRIENMYRDPDHRVLLDKVLND